MTPTDLDTLIAHLKAPNVIATDIDPKVLAAGLEDLRNRMAHVEFSYLKVLSQHRANSDHLTAVDNQVGALTIANTEFQKQVTTATNLPLENQKKIAELDARVHTCEGAVGAAPYKAPEPIHA